MSGHRNRSRKVDGSESKSVVKPANHLFTNIPIILGFEYTRALIHFNEHISPFSDAFILVAVCSIHAVNSLSFTGPDLCFFFFFFSFFFFLLSNDIASSSLTDRSIYIYVDERERESVSLSKRIFIFPLSSQRFSSFLFFFFFIVRF